VTLRAFERTIAPSHFLEATPVDVEEFLAAHIAPRTRHAYRSDLKCFYAWAIRRRLATSNPAAETDSVRLPKLLPRPVGPELIAALIVTAPAEWVGTALALAERLEVPVETMVMAAYRSALAKAGQNGS
jgi:site-specific recombinase XerD